MKREETRREIISVWRKWVSEHNVTAPTGDDTLRFYQYLQQQRYDLLFFEYSGTDKYQQVHAWLKGANLVSD
jgi:hypothetical protein